jgi:hypothetical protein
MKYNVGDTVYTIQEYGVQINEHRITKVILTEQGAKYYLNGKDVGVEEKSLFKKSKVKSHLMKQLKEKHRGEMLQARRQIEKLS